MRFGQLSGLDKPVSQVIIGCELHDGTEVWDRFAALGGNAFDTSHVWCNGAGEHALGRWLAKGGRAKSSVVVVKGGHTPQCAPESIVRQLQESLGRLRLETADIYLVHRDNPAIPVGEFVDVLHEQAEAGYIRVCGVSNWTIPRLRNANEYAARQGRRRIQVLSNNLSLATMAAPPRRGLVSAAGADFRAFLALTQMAHFAWSSQAQGYFHGKKLLAYDSAENRERCRRAAQLASRLGVSAGHIATAYVLCQPFPSFAIIGSRTGQQVEDSLRGLEIKLDGRRLSWLNLETETV